MQPPLRWHSRGKGVGARRPTHNGYVGNAVPALALFSDHDPKLSWKKWEEPDEKTDPHSPFQLVFTTLATANIGFPAAAGAPLATETRGS